MYVDNETAGDWIFQHKLVIFISDVDVSDLNIEVL